MPGGFFALGAAIGLGISYYYQWDFYKALVVMVLTGVATEGTALLLLYGTIFTFMFFIFGGGDKLFSNKKRR